MLRVHVRARFCVCGCVSVCERVCTWKSEVNLVYYSLGVIPLDFTLRQALPWPGAH